MRVNDDGGDTQEDIIDTFRLKHERNLRQNRALLSGTRYYNPEAKNHRESIPVNMNDPRSGDRAIDKSPDHGRVIMPTNFVQWLG